MDQQADSRPCWSRWPSGRRTVDDAVLKLKMEPFEELGYAKVDSHRGLRQGAAEVIYGAGKTPEQIAGHCRPPCAPAASETILITRHVRRRRRSRSDAAASP